MGLYNTLFELRWTKRRAILKRAAGGFLARGGCVLVGSQAVIRHTLIACQGAPVVPTDRRLHCLETFQRMID